jgi:hypothetical protein
MLAVAIARGQPMGPMKLYRPAEELETVRRGLPIADEGAVDVEVNVHPAAIRDPRPFSLRVKERRNNRRGQVSRGTTSAGQLESISIQAGRVKSADPAGAYHSISGGGRAGLSVALRPTAATGRR